MVAPTRQTSASKARRIIATPPLIGKRREFPPSGGRRPGCQPARRLVLPTPSARAPSRMKGTIRITGILSILRSLTLQDTESRFVRNWFKHRSRWHRMKPRCRLHRRDRPRGAGKMGVMGHAGKLGMAGRHADITPTGRTAAVHVANGWIVATSARRRFHAKRSTAPAGGEQSHQAKRDEKPRHAEDFQEGDAAGRHSPSLSAASAKSARKLHLTGKVGRSGGSDWSLWRRSFASTPSS
jgi:hypothetical protein